MAVGTVSSTTSDNWQLISTTSISAGTATPITFSSVSGYKTLMLSFKNVTTSVDSYLIVRFNNDTSYGTYAVSNSGWNYFIIGPNGTTGQRAGVAIIYDADKTLPHKVETSGYDTAANTPLAYYTDPVAITRIDLIAREGGTFSAGTVYLYGIAA